MTAPTTKITMPVHQLHGLLKPVLPFAGDDLMLPVLCAVQLVVTPTALYAAATDRYTLAIRRLKPEGIEISGDTPVRALWATSGITDVLAQIKQPRNNHAQHQVQLDITGVRDQLHTGIDGIQYEKNDQTLTVEYTEPYEQDAVRFEHHTVSGNVPDLFSLARKMARRDTDTDGAVQPRGLNPRLLARFRHVAGRHDPVKVINDGPTAPVLVLADYDDGDFLGLQMPMRLDGHKAAGWPAREELLAAWRDLNPLGTPDTTEEGAA